MTKPFIKWVGGKRSLLDELTTDLPDFKKYYEPFLGGGALFFRLFDMGYFEDAGHLAYLNDLNRNLIATYNEVKHRPEALLKSLRRHRLMFERNPKLRYETIVQSFNIDPKPAQFIFLNKTGFNGLYRVNKKGYYNVPWNKNVEANFVDYDTIRDCSKALKKVWLSSREYKEFVSIHSHAFIEDSLFYFDPPYYKTFRDYITRSDETDLDFHEELAQTANELKSKGVYVMISNSDEPEIRELYKAQDWNITQIKGRRSISCDGKGREAKQDLLIRSW